MTTNDGGPERSAAVRRLIERANNLNSIVEGIQSVRWAYGRCRFKDSREWCQFYSALAAVNDETAMLAARERQEKGKA